MIDRDIYRTLKEALSETLAVYLLGPRQSAESLAGRIRYLELHPFSLLGTSPIPMDTFWLRGVFLNSLLAQDDARSLRWRIDFIRTYFERDTPQFGPCIAAETLRRLIQLCWDEALEWR